jgi:hypothetical protein
MASESRKCRIPCKTCPWRVGSRGDEIPNFSMELAEGLSNTITGELGAPIFACHQSKEGGEIPCAGWLARYGWDSLVVRINLINGANWMDFFREDGGLPDDWPELFPDFKSMLANLRDTF